MDHSMHGMGDMDMDSSSSSSGHSMAMSFFDAHDTMLFSTQWTPSNAGQYAGTCIFLIVLAIIFCMLNAYRHILEVKWSDRDNSRRYVTVASPNERDQEKEGGLLAEGERESTLTVNGVKEQVRVIRTPHKAGVHVKPWRLSTDLPRACIFTVQHGVGYLL